MKSWKTVTVVSVIVVLIVALAFMANYVLQDKDVRAMKARIEQYKVVAEEQALIRQILEDKIAVAKIQAQLAPQPVTPEPATPE